MVKNLPAMQETRVRALDQEDSLEKGTGYPLQYPCLMGGKPPNSDYDLSGVSLTCFEKCSEAFLQSTHWAVHHWLLWKIHFSLHVTIQSRNGSLLLCRIKEDDTTKWWFFSLICSQFMRHLLNEFFHLSNLLQMPNGRGMVELEFFSNFSCGCKRISFSDYSQLLAVSFRWLATLLLIFKTLVSFAKLLEPPLHWTQFLGQMRCWGCELSPLLYNPFWMQIKKITRICFLSSVSTV